MKEAVYTGTRNVYGDMETSAKSIIANSDVDMVYFLIEDDEFPHELPELIECRNVSGQKWFNSECPNAAARYTYMALLRAALFELFPDKSKILSLDCDTVAISDCSDVWDIDVSGCYFAAVQEKWCRGRPGLQYCNVGVSLLNLDMLRDGKGNEIIELLNSHSYAWPEQDAMNYLCQGRIAVMHPKFNSCPWTVDIDVPEVIIHFAAESSWSRGELLDKKRYETVYRDMTWDDVMERHNNG